MKRYRNAKGQLTISLEEIKKKTIVEASDYYKPGSIYLNAADGREYVYLLPVPGDGELAVSYTHLDVYKRQNMK